MQRNNLILVGMAVLVAVMLFFAARQSRSGQTAGGATVSGPLGLAGQTAPEFTLQSLDDKTVHLSDYKGKAVLVNFWATWCAPCKIEIPWFVDLQKQYGPQGLQIIGIAMDDASPKDIAKFAQDMGVNYPVLLGKEAVGDAYGGVQFLPVTVYVGRDGKVINKFFGLKGRAEIEDSIKKALSQGAAAGQ